MFKTSATENQGYFVGRYEARTGTKRTSNTTLTVATVKPNDYVYNCITQPDAATQSRTMYNSNTSSFNSDLMNSYAWDTAIVFLQEFDNRTKKYGVYSIALSLNYSLAEKGTNNLSASQQDKICNVWDMASNAYEWTTETSIYANFKLPCVLQGGLCGSTNDAGTRDSTSTTDAGALGYNAFRLALYLKN